STQIKVFKSHQILQKVVNKLGLNGSAEYNAEIIAALRESINVYQVTDENADSKKDSSSATKIIQVNYVATSPSETKKVLKAIQEVYLKYNLEQQEKRLKDALTFIDQQIPQARRQLTKTEAALTQLTKENNLVSPEAEATSIKENIRQIAQEREALKAQVGEIAGSSSARQEQLGVSAENALALSRLSQSPQYQNLLNSLKQIEQDIATKQTKFTNDNPALQSAFEEQKSVQDLLSKEAARILGELPPNFNRDLQLLQKQGLIGSNTGVANAVNDSQAKLSGIRQRDLSLAQTEAKLEQRLVDFPELISQYRNLTQESEIKRQALQKLLEAKQDLEIELSRGANNWQVIEPPQAGLQIAPNLAKDLLLSLVVATFMGGFAAFLKDFTDETINTSKEIERRTSFPILGTAPGLSISNNILARLPFGASSNSISPIQDVIRWQPFREAIDLIYENLKLSYFNSPLVGPTLKSIAITSAVTGEGKSTLVVGLALSIARHRQKVLVIDGDL
ncbi:MAG: GumC family protein, partial [Waterburya sp.]